MQFDGAVIQEQGVKFAIVTVKQHILHNPQTIAQARQSFAAAFPSMPIVLMAQDNRKIPHWHGRPDIVNFLRNVPVEAIPWKRYTLR